MNKMIMFFLMMLAACGIASATVAIICTPNPTTAWTNTSCSANGLGSYKPAHFNWYDGANTLRFSDYCNSGTCTSAQMPDSTGTWTIKVVKDSDPSTYLSTTLAVTVTCTDSDDDGYYADTKNGLCGTQTDCNDLDATVSPDADELCDNFDNNCNGNVDESLTRSANGAGLCSGNTETCIAGEWNANNEYTPAKEVCGNSIDENCDGVDDVCDPSVPEFGTVAALLAGLGGIGITFFMRKN